MWDERNAKRKNGEKIIPMASLVFLRCVWNVELRRRLHRWQRLAYLGLSESKWRNWSALRLFSSQWTAPTFSRPVWIAHIFHNFSQLFFSCRSAFWFALTNEINVIRNVASKNNDWWENSEFTLFVKWNLLFCYFSAGAVHALQKKYRMTPFSF